MYITTIYRKYTHGHLDYSSLRWNCPIMNYFASTLRPSFYYTDITTCLYVQHVSLYNNNMWNRDEAVAVTQICIADASLEDGYNASMKFVPCTRLNPMNMLVTMMYCVLSSENDTFYLYLHFHEINVVSRPNADKYLAFRVKFKPNWMQSVTWECKVIATRKSYLLMTEIVLSLSVGHRRNILVVFIAHYSIFLSTSSFIEVIPVEAAFSMFVFITFLAYQRILCCQLHLFIIHIMGLFAIILILFFKIG